MPIEFRCTQCDRLLRTQDETAGKKAKCPECGTILTIPTPGTSPEMGTSPPVGPPPSPAVPPSPASPPPPGAGPPSPFGPIEPPPDGPRSPFGLGAAPDAENPYASPADYTMGAPAQAAAPGAIVPTRIDPGDILARAWTIYKDQWLMCIGAVLIVGILNWVVAQIASFSSAVIGPLSGDPVVAYMCMILGMFASQLFALWLNIGLALLFLDVARGREPSLGDLFRGGPYYLTVLVATILVTLVYCAGLVLLIIPGIIFALMLSQYFYLIVDRNVGIIESLELSKQITHGNKLMILVLWLLSVALVFAGFLMCCVGVIFTAPLVSLMYAVAYLAMTGQPTGDRQYHPQASAPYADGTGASPFGAAPGNGT